MCNYHNNYILKNQHNNEINEIYFYFGKNISYTFCFQMDWTE